MSEDGFYVAGYGVDTVTFEYFAYRVNIESVGLAEMSPEKIKISPNPAHSVIQIDNVGEGQIEILNVEGKIILSTKVFGNTAFNISNFEAGVYQVHFVETATQYSTRSKFIKL